MKKAYKKTFLIPGRSCSRTRKWQHTSALNQPHSGAILVATEASTLPSTSRIAVTFLLPGNHPVVFKNCVFAALREKIFVR
jgi:hypothetical protein